jgi:leucine dehydrogenase
MSLFETLEKNEHEQIVFCSDSQTGLRAIIAIHNTILGPSLGGVRMRDYKSENDAINDVLRLSRDMTYKAAAAGLNLGGGKAVIIGDPATQKNEFMLRSFGKFIDGLGGRYITATEVGTTVNDMQAIRLETPYVAGISSALGGSGDPAPVTAYGVYVGMKACARFTWGNDSLRGKKIVLQGAGNVSGFLCEHLAGEGAILFVSDIVPEKLEALQKRVQFTKIAPDKIFSAECDIFSPNALGQVINDNSLKKLKTKIIAGSANNQLENEEKHSQELINRSIVYAPDFVINAGGLINIANELEGYRRDRAQKQTEGIYDTLLNIFISSREQNISTTIAANRLALNRIEKIGNLQKRSFQPLLKRHTI